MLGFRHLRGGLEQEVSLQARVLGEVPAEVKACHVKPGDFVSVSREGSASDVRDLDCPVPSRQPVGVAAFLHSAQRWTNSSGCVCVGHHVTPSAETLGRSIPGAELVFAALTSSLCLKVLLRTSQ